MTKTTATALRAKLATRNSYIEAVKIAAIDNVKHVDGTDQFEVDIDVDLDISEKLEALAAEGFDAFGSSGERVFITLTNELKKLKVERIRLDNQIAAAAKIAVAKGRNYFIIETRKYAQDCKEAIEYLCDLGFKVETHDHSMRIFF